MPPPCKMLPFSTSRSELETAMRPKDCIALPFTNDMKLFWLMNMPPLRTAPTLVMLNTASLVLLAMAEFSRIASKSRIIVPPEFSKLTSEIMISSPSGSSPESAEIVPVLTIPPET